MIEPKRPCSFKKGVAEFDEVGVQVGHAGIDAVEAFERGLVFAEHLLAYPGWIADHYVETGLLLLRLSVPSPGRDRWHRRRR